MAPAPVRPLVAVIGATGTGKSDLAVEIARRFDGEIINGDAMQLYHGLPIITNKITPDEMKGVPHHLLGRIGLEEETWTVGNFVKNASKVIDEIRSRGKLPVLVGGTHYYTQSLLFQDAIPDEPLLKLDDRSQQFPILNESTDTILGKLKEVDPVMADRWHPNERRKIQRSLEIYLRTGKPASQVYEEQRSQQGEPSDVDGQDQVEPRTSLRYPTILFWVHASKDVLHPRLDARIVKMLDRGLLEEVKTLSDFKISHEARTGSIVDQSRGIWVSIGYKEFIEYQNALTDNTMSEVQLEKTRIAAIEKMQAATRQYANRQVRWIRIKLLNALLTAGQKSKMFLLDGTNLSLWEDHVLHPARDIMTQYLSNEEIPDPSSLSEAASEMLNPKRNYDLGQRPDLWQKKTCEICGTVAVTENDWSNHVKSRGHRRAVGSKKKQENARKREGPSSPKRPREDLVDVLETYVQTFPDEVDLK